MKHPENTLSLVADIGGTNTRCALANGKTVLPDTIRRYSNADFPDLQTVLRKYLVDEDGVDPIAACVAVAGPVRDDRATMTNLDWKIDEHTLANATNAETVALLNDLQAQGHALGHLDGSSIRSVIGGAADAVSETATKLVIGVGTGFNAAAVFETPNGRLVTPSECGHVDLPVEGETEAKLAEFLKESHGFAAIEDALSGRGLERVYTFINDGVSGTTAQKIMTDCAADTNETASEAVAVFAKILGRVCGNLSLIHLPFGGVYLVGGVARAITPYLGSSEFEDSFRAKGRFSEFMTNFPVNVVEDDYAALIGSASYIHSRLQP